MLPLVNRVLIPEEQINRESGEVEADSIDEKRAEAARRLAIRELLRQRARELEIDTEDNLDRAIDELLVRELEVPKADERACRHYFESNRDCFVTPVAVEMRHILLAAAPDDGETRVAMRDTADTLIATIRDEPARFAELAAKHSRCPSAGDGGLLGQIGKGQTVPELENVVLRLPVGLAERPIETRYGFHVVEVLDRSGGDPLEYEDVQHLIADYLRERSWRRAVSQYLHVLISDAEIQGIDLDAADSPLLQ